jgi:hypothetical protein
METTDSPEWARGPIGLTEADREAIRRFIGKAETAEGGPGAQPWLSADPTGDAPVRPGAHLIDDLDRNNRRGQDDGRRNRDGGAQDYLISFGRYRSLTLSQVAREPRGRAYLRWLLEQRWVNGQLRRNVVAFLSGKRPGVR